MDGTIDIDKMPPITKTRLFKYNGSPPKTDISDKNSYTFYISAQNIDFGITSRRQF